MKFDNQYEREEIPETICKCFVFNSRSLIMIVIKLAGINAKAIDMKNTKLLLFLVEL